MMITLRLDDEQVRVLLSACDDARDIRLSTVDKMAQQLENKTSAAPCGAILNMVKAKIEAAIIDTDLLVKHVQKVAAGAERTQEGDSGKPKGDKR